MLMREDREKSWLRMIEKLLKFLFSFPNIKGSNWNQHNFDTILIL